MAKPKDKATDPAQPASVVEEPAVSDASSGEGMAPAVVPSQDASLTADQTKPKDKTAGTAQPASRFRVRGLGTLRLNGEVYQAGEELALTEAEVTALACPAIERF